MQLLKQQGRQSRGGFPSLLLFDSGLAFVFSFHIDVYSIRVIFKATKTRTFGDYHLRDAFRNIDRQNALKK